MLVMEVGSRVMGWGWRREVGDGLMVVGVGFG